MSNIHESVKAAILAQLQGTARMCPMCGRKSVVPLQADELAEQPDETTHVCHPAISGCNHGFEDMALKAGG